MEDMLTLYAYTIDIYTLCILRIISTKYIEFAKVTEILR